jgi:hypothetical protein
MTFIIRDPVTGHAAGVDLRGRLETHSTSRTQTEAQSVLGQAFVINSGEITITGDTALLYVKNNGLLNLHADFLALGVGTPTGSFAGTQTLEVTRNPTGGTTISSAIDVDIKANQNFGSSNQFSDIIAYQGADGETVTGGSMLSFFFQNGTGRLSAGLSWVMPPGSSVGLTFKPNLASGNVPVYVAIIGYLDQPDD